MAKFNEEYNELELIGEPLPEHVKVRKFCMSLTEPCLGDQATTVMTSPETVRNFAAATARLQIIQSVAIKKQAAGGNQGYIAELGTGKHGCRGGGGHPRKKRRKKGGSGGSQLHNYTDKQWHALSDEKKVQVRALHDAAKVMCEAGVASAKTDSDKDAEKGGSKFGNGAHT
jgi:hypothetical protein